MKISPKQRDVLADCRKKRSRLIFFHGSVRSMKTITANIFWTYLIEKNPGRSVMAGVTIETLLSNVLEPMKQMIPNSITWKDNGRRIWIGGNEVKGVGGKNCDAADVIRGRTIKNFYIDEGTKIHPDFFRMALSRLSEPGSTMIMTTNPDSPYHFLKNEFIDRQNELNLSVYHFHLEENIFLGQQYIDDLKDYYANSPLWYDRYINGLWVQAEGAIYPKFNPKTQVIDCPKSFPNVIVSYDYGTVHPCVFLMIGWHTPDKIYIFKEYFYDGSKNTAKDDADYLRDFADFVRGYNPSVIYMDNAPISASFNIALKRLYRGCKLANNDVLPGIQTFSKMLPQIFIDKSCTNSIRQLSGYSWNNKSLKDEPLKIEDDCPDAARYGIHSHFPGGYIKTISPIISGKR